MFELIFNLMFYLDSLLTTELLGNTSSKMGKSAEVDNIPAELVQAGREAMIDIMTSICNRVWKTGE